jgi:ComF family protein
MQLLQSLLEIVYPTICLTCQQAIGFADAEICLQCQYELPFTNQHTDSKNSTAQKFWGRIPLQAAFSYLYFVQGGKVQILLHELKYRGNEQVGEFLGRLFGAELKRADLAKNFDLIVPIPLHASKLQKRGYNQVDSIARGMTETMQVAWQADALLRVRANISQTTQDKMGRFSNSKELFEVKNKEDLANKNILLLDDVITTGATIEAAAQVIFAAGCKSLSVAAIATGV